MSLDEATNAEPPFTMGPYHKKALVTLLHLYHGNRQKITYDELSLRIGTSLKNKSWQCGAWKDLKSIGYIVQAEKKLWELSAKGVKLASTLMSVEELAEFLPPDTNEKLHEKIKARMVRHEKAKSFGPRILNLMLAPDYIPLNRNQMAATFNTLADSHGFFYGLKWLKDNGYVEFCDPKIVAEYKEAMETKKMDKGIATTKDVATVKEETDFTSDDTVGQKRKAGASIVSEDDTKADKPKKKKYESTKKREGGKPLKLSHRAYVDPPKTAW